MVVAQLGASSSIGIVLSQTRHLDGYHDSDAGDEIESFDLVGNPAYHLPVRNEK
jgi:hypothetical protein